MGKENPITEVTTKIYSLLESLDSADRRKCISAAMVLLDEDVLNLGPSRSVATIGQPVIQNTAVDWVEGDRAFGEKANRWMLQYKITRSQLDQIFHIDDNRVELIIDAVPGQSKREKTVNCYLLVGIRNYLQADEPKFADREALEFCHMTQCYDKNNHTANRQSLSNRVSGDRTTAFTLTVPGLRDAANLIKEIVTQDD